MTDGQAAVSALSAGGILAKAGCSTVNLIVLPLLLIPMVTTLEYALSKRAPGRCVSRRPSSR